MSAEQSYWYFEHTKKKWFYEIHVTRNLFGGWLILKHNGGTAGKGRLMTENYDDAPSCAERLLKLLAHRQQARGYYLKDMQFF